MSAARSSRLATPVALALALLAGGAARADVTAAQVWDNLRGALEANGQTLAVGAVRDTGDGLVAADVTLSAVSPEATFTARIGDIGLRERGDGTVELSLAPRQEIRIEKPGDDTRRLRLGVVPEGLSIIASGDEAKVAYDVKAGAIRLVTDEGAVGPGKQAEISALLSGIKGRYELGTGLGGAVPVPVSSFLSAARLTLDASGHVEEKDETIELSVEMDDISSSNSGTTMRTGPEEMAAALKAGLAVDSRLAHGPARYRLNFSDAEETLRFDATESAGHVAVKLSRDGLGVEVVDSDLSVTLSGSDIPLPEVAFALETLRLGLAMPVLESSTPGRLALGLRLEQLAPSALIWSALDPGGNLPHDPATVVVELEGKGNWSFDVFDPASAAAVAAEAPGELHELSLTELRIAAAGAVLEGSGSFVFDNSDLDSFGGVPRPTGAIDLILTGGNALLDRLVRMGLLPEEQAMGVRMMSAIFARPTGEDVLSSRIEITPDGAVLANGQRLK